MRAPAPSRRSRRATTTHLAAPPCSSRSPSSGRPRRSASSPRPPAAPWRARRPTSSARPPARASRSRFASPRRAPPCARSPGASSRRSARGRARSTRSQAGDATYEPAAQVQQSFTVGSPAPSLSVQTINFTSTPPATATIGGPDYAVAATASSGLPVAFSVSAGSAGVCSVSGAYGLARRRRHLHDRRRPGRLRELPAPRRRRSSPSRSAARHRRSASPRRRRFPPPSAARTTPSPPPRRSGLAVAFAAVPASAGVCSRLRLDRLARRRRDLHGASRTRRGNAVHDAAAPGAAVVHGRSGRADAEPADDQLHLDGAERRRRRRPRRTPSRRRPAPASRSPSRSRPRARASASSPARRSRSSASGTCTINATRPATRATSRRSRCSSRSRSRRRRRPADDQLHLDGAGRAVYGGPALHGLGDRELGPCRSPSRLAPAAPASARSPARRCRSSASVPARSTRTRPGTATYCAAPQVQQSFTVARAPQTITFTSTPPVGRRQTSGSTRHRHRDVRARGLVQHRLGERRRLRRFGAWIFFYRQRHLHRPREPGRQRELPAGAAGAAVDRGHGALTVTDDPSPDRGRPAPA